MVLLPDDRLVHGTVQDVKSGAVQVNIGELISVFLSVYATRGQGDAPVHNTINVSGIERLCHARCEVIIVNASMATNPEAKSELVNGFTAGMVARKLASCSTSHTNPL